VSKAAFAAATAAVLERTNPAVAAAMAASEGSKPAADPAASASAGSLSATASAAASATSAADPTLLSKAIPRGAALLRELNGLGRLSRDAILAGADMPWFDAAAKGLFVRLARPAPRDPGVTIPDKDRYRMAVCLGVTRAPRPYTVAPGVVSDVLVRYAFGSGAEVPLPGSPEEAAARMDARAFNRDHALDAASDPTRMRTARLSEVSNSEFRLCEYEAYALRLAHQYSFTQTASDLCPTRADLQSVRNRYSEAERSFCFSADTVQSQLARNVGRIKVSEVQNLSMLRIATEAQLLQLEATFESLTRDSKERLAVARDVARLKQRLAEIADEERRRQDKAEAEERRVLEDGTGRLGATLLTKRSNQTVEAYNKEKWARASAAMMGKSTADHDAEADKNPYLRRRTKSEVLWHIPGRATAAEEAKQRETLKATKPEAVDEDDEAERIHHAAAAAAHEDPLAEGSIVAGSINPFPASFSAAASLVPSASLSVTPSVASLSQLLSPSSLTAPSEAGGAKKTLTLAELKAKLSQAGKL
jgi:hypothetical protein